MSGFGVFGKLPWQADFARRSAAGALFTSWDDWLVSSIEWAHQRAGDPWRSAFSRGAVWAFLYHPPGQSEEVLAGAMAPSADQAGRLFPVSIAAPIALERETPPRPELVPIVLEDVWQAASDLAAEVPALSPSTLDQRLDSPSWSCSPAAEAAATYQQWIAELPVSELWALLYGQQQPEQPARALRLLIEAVRPCRDVEHPSTPLSLWLPLGQASGAAVCFWLDLTRRLANWRKTVPCFFWSHDGTSGRMLLHLGVPPPSTTAELWDSNGQRDEFCDLASPVGDHQVAALPELPGDLADALRTGRAVEHLLRCATRPN